MVNSINNIYIKQPTVLQVEVANRYKDYYYATVMYVKRRNLLLNKIAKHQNKLQQYEQELKRIEKHIAFDVEELKMHMDNISLTERMNGIYVLVPSSFRVSRYAADVGYSSGYAPDVKVMFDNVLHYRELEKLCDSDDCDDVYNVDCDYNNNNPKQYTYNVSKLEQLVDGKQLYIGFDIDNGHKYTQDMQADGNLGVKIYYMKWW